MHLNLHAYVAGSIATVAAEPTSVHRSASKIERIRSPTDTEAIDRWTYTGAAVARSRAVECGEHGQYADAECPASTTPLVAGTAWIGEGGTGRPLPRLTSPPPRRSPTS